MKKLLLFILLATIGTSYGIYSYKQNLTAEKQLAAKEKFDAKWKMKAAKIEGFLQWRNEMTKNVFTGEVDRNDYYNALRQADLLKTQQANKADGILNLEWTSRGPSNVGGRTRAILIDKDNANLIYAGSVSGGLFKSTDFAENWERVEGYGNNNASIMSLAQTVNGTLFVGTGETLGNSPDGSLFNAGFTGDGIYKSNDGGVTFTQIDVTNEFNFPTFAGEWSSVRSMATHPTNSNILAVGNNNGIRISTNAEAAQPTFTNAAGVIANVSDVKFTSDGKELWATANGRVFRSTDEVGNFTNFTQVSPVNTGARAQIAISTVDASGDFIVYASVTNGSGCLVGVYKTENKGTSWTQIAFAGGPDPFAQPTADPGTGQCQGWYDHCIAVNPTDKDRIYIGGITFYTWASGSAGLKRADQIDSEGSGSLSPEYIHADKHTIVFSQHDATGNTMFIGGDGGVNRCLNANSGFPDNMVYTENNKNYTTLQCYSAGSGKYGEVIAGAQDNGSQYVDYKGLSLSASKEVSGGDGVGGAEISNLSPDILFTGVYFGQLLRSLNNGASSTSFLDENIDPAGCGHITCTPLNTAAGETCDDRPEDEGQNFIYPFYLMETYDRKTPRNDLFIYAKDETLTLPGGAVISIKDTLQPGDVTKSVKSLKIPKLDLNNLGLNYTLTNTMYPGDTTFFENKFDAKYFVPSKCGTKFFVCTNPLQEGTAPVFSSVAVSNQSGISRMDGSNDGDLLAAVAGSRVIIMQGWDAYDPITNPSAVTNVQVNLSSIGAGSLTGVYVDKNNKDHVLVSEAGYGSASKVFVSFNATSASPTFVNIHNNLPEMPIYSCVIDKANSQRYILGTELGIWASNDGGTTWFEDNEGMGGRFPVFALRQKWMNNFDCNVITAGTMGAGLFTTTTLMDCANKDNLIWGRPADTTPIDNVYVEINSIAIYPNPVSDAAKITFNLTENADVALKIVDLTGKVVLQKTYKGVIAGNTTLDVNVSHLAKSSYFAIITANNKNYNSRLFIKK